MLPLVPGYIAQISGISIDNLKAGEGGTRARFSRLDLRGSIVVTDAALFVPALLSGFGRARALGYGPMLIEHYRPDAATRPMRAPGHPGLLDRGAQEQARHGGREDHD